MKYVLFFILFSMVLACASRKESKEATYVAEPCVGMKEIDQTEVLQINDTIPGFSGTTSSGIDFNIADLQGDFIFIFFKKGENPIGGLINEELTYKSIGKLVIQRQGNILVESDLKIAKIYGISFDESYKLKKSTLIIADKDRMIREIYEDVCEDDIVKLLKAM